MSTNTKVEHLLHIFSAQADDDMKSGPWSLNKSATWTKDGIVNRQNSAAGVQKHAFKVTEESFTSLEQINNFTPQNEPVPIHFSFAQSDAIDDQVSIPANDKALACIVLRTWKASTMGGNPKMVNTGVQVYFGTITSFSAQGLTINGFHAAERVRDFGGALATKKTTSQDFIAQVQQPERTELPSRGAWPSVNPPDLGNASDDWEKQVLTV